MEEQPIISEGATARGINHEELQTSELLATEDILFIGNDSPDELDDNNKKPKKKLPKKALLLGLIGIIFLVVLGGGGYYAYSQDMLSFLKKKPAPASNTQKPIVDSEQIPEPKPEPLSKPLIATYGTLTIGGASIKEISTKLTQKLLSPAGEGITALYLTSTETSAGLTFTDALVAAGIAMPSSVLISLDVENYTLFLTSEAGGKITRLGLVVAVSDILQINDDMRTWENTLIEDTDRLLRKLGKETNVGQPIFKTGTRDSISIQFVNFPDPTLSMAYAISRDAKLLFIGTSRDNIFKAIDAI